MNKEQHKIVIESLVSFIKRASQKDATPAEMELLADVTNALVNLNQYPVPTC